MSVLPFDHHPGACHGDLVTFPVIPVDSFSMFSAAIDTIQVGMVAALIPPGPCPQLSTMTVPYIIVTVLCGEGRLVVVSEGIT